MNKKIIISILVIAAIAAASFNLRPKSEGITLGVIAPLSGQYAAIGENFFMGIKLAAVEYAGAHPGTSIELISEDDGFDAKKGFSAYKKLVSINHIDALVNLTTPTIEAIYDEASKTTLPVMQWGIQTRPAIVDNIFQVTPDGNDAIKKFARFIAIKNYTNVAVVYENGAAQIGFFKAFEEEYERPYIGHKVESTSSYRPFVAKILGGKHDAVFIMMNGESGALFTKEMLTQGKQKIALYYDAQLQSGWADYKRILGDTNIINGAYSLWVGDSNAAFTEAFEKMYGKEPGFGADYGYDAFTVLMKAHAADPLVWQKNIQNSVVDGATGQLSFDANGVRIQDIVINEVKGGEVVRARQ